MAALTAAEPAAEGMTWARAFSLLIKHGHPPSAIYDDYSWGQFKAFLKEAQAHDNQRHAMTLIAARLGALIQGGSQEADEALLELVQQLTASE